MRVVFYLVPDSLKVLSIQKAPGREGTMQCDKYAFVRHVGETGPADHMTEQKGY